jgi:hypothetical protein
MPAPDPVSASFADLVQRELETSEAKKLPEASSATPEQQGTPDWLRNPDRDLFGLALSGGGVRSATFNLGLLQGLAPLGLLRNLDYLATVSGGGYIGGFWTAWRRGNGGGPDFPTEEDPTTAASRKSSEPAPIHRLRQFGNFLNPRLGLFNFDTGRIVAAVFAAMIPTLLTAAALIALVTMAWLALATVVLTPPAWLPAFGAALVGLTPEFSRSVLALVVVSAAILLLAEMSWRRKEKSSHSREYIAISTFAVAVSAAIWFLQTRWPAPALPARSPLLLWSDVNAPRLLIWPVIAWTSAAVALAFVRFVVSSFARSRDALQSAIDRVLSRLLFASVVWLVLASLWIVARQVVGDTSVWPEVFGAAGTAGLAMALTRLQSIFARQPNKPAGSKLMAFLRPRLPQLFSYGFVALFSVLVMATVAGLATQLGALFVLGGAVAISLVTLLFFEPNDVGLHAFYRARLGRAFLGAANAQYSDDVVTEPQPNDDFLMTECPQERPLHLVCCAANDLASNRQFLHLHRGAASAVFSRVGFSVGNDWRTWPRDGQQVTTMGDAITASAAAFNSQMGAWSVKLGPAAVFTLSALNLRLGMWWPHPRTRAGFRLMRGLPFYKEMLGITSAGGNDIHLSDGGHFENMALYELIRRHCRYIIASDCGADPDVAFDDLGNLVRRVREDFGVEISIDLTPLRPVDGRARQPMVAGDIQYPDGDTGILLLFKPTLIGSEPADVLQYSRRNKAFPHESTGDQFYDEAQWESYRRLGLHAAASAFRFLSAQTPVSRAMMGPAALRMESARIFSRARFEWMPPPHGFLENVDEIAQAHAAIDAVLREPDALELRQQVFRDFSESDGTQLGRAGKTAALNALPFVREVLRHMEQIFHLAQLAEHGSHPLNLGTMNTFGRWTGADLFQQWWPLIRGLYSSPFAAFMERNFGLKSHAKVLFKELPTAAHRTGFAIQAFQLARGDGFDFGQRIVHGFYAESTGTPGGVALDGIQLGVLVASRFSDGGPAILCWDANDFFIPPGLWGMGIGNQCLSALTSADQNLLVRIGKPLSGGWAAGKAAADATQMYRSVGFSDAPVQAGSEERLSSILETEAGMSYRWLRRGSTLATPQRVAQLQTPAAQ